MYSAQRLLKQFQLISQTMRRSSALYCITSNAEADIFEQKAAEWSQKTLPVHNETDKAMLEGLQMMSAMMSWGNTAVDLRNTVISRTYAMSSFFVYAVNGRKQVVIYNGEDTVEQAQKVLDTLNAVLVPEFNTQLRLEKAPLAYVDELDERIAAAREYYVTSHGEWTQQFIDNLGDELSKISFRTFLKQRIEAHIRWNSLAMYPITPPVETQAWRNERQQHPPFLPRIEHCPTWARDFFHLHSFIYEQYGIPGVVEALPGQTVIDAGAYIADTALYFAPKVGDTGKVYAFEAMPENIEAAEANLQLNNCKNVHMVPLALSDSCGELRFNLNTIAPSGSGQDAQGEVAVQSVDLDSFVHQHGLHVGFIKSDIEGGEMAFLRGAAKTIQRDGPTCGLALYHKQADYHEIPSFLQSLRPEYTFYFRCDAEPVLFATIKPE